MDDVRRRHYIIDADVETQTMELMSCGPQPDTKGRVGAVTHGGMRRIDRVLVRTNQHPVHSLKGIMRLNLVLN